MSNIQKPSKSLVSNKQADVYREIHHLVTSTLENPESEKAKELQEFLAKDEATREVYAIYMHETSTLRSTGLVSPLAAEVSEAIGQVIDQEKTLVKAPSNNIRHASHSKGLVRKFTAFVLAASLLLMLGSLLQSYRLDSAKANLGEATMAGVNSPSDVNSLIDASSDDAEESTPDQESASEKKIATLTRTIGIEWQDDSNAPFALSRLASGQTLSFSSGQAEIVFDKGIELLVTGPAELEIVSSLHVIATRGTYSARVGEHGIGFTIDTPVTSVIDLGTEFGLAINDSGETDVAVFVGAVDLETNRNSPTPELSDHKRFDRIRLDQGQAINVDKLGQYSRIVSVSTGQFPVPGLFPELSDEKQALISDVRDNIRDPDSMNFYRVVHRGLREDAMAFVDRTHEWNGIDDAGIPEILRGADYVMPFNDDKSINELEVTIDISEPCHLFVFLDNNMKVPDWLARDFYDSGLKIGLDEGISNFGKHTKTGHGPGKSIDSRFSVWQRDITEPCQVTLGSVETPADKHRGWNMFGIAARAFF